MASIRAHFAQRLRSSSLATVPPPQASPDYSLSLAKVAKGIVYQSPRPSQAGLPIYILNAAAFPDPSEVDYDALLPYLFETLPSEEELLSGIQYEVIFFAGGGDDGVTTNRKASPGWAWSIRVYNALSRATRKRLEKLYIVHERTWVRVMLEMFSTIVSPKFRKKVVHVSTLSSFALQMPLENLLIPPSAYIHDRRLSPDIYVPYASGRRAFAVQQPFPLCSTGKRRLPRVLRETTRFVLIEPNVRTEGLFRISAHKKMVDILREAYDRGQKYIIWKEGETFSPLPAHENVDPTLIEEMPARETYGVHLAAGLIKLWYRELRTPLFSQSSYRDLRTRFPISEEAVTFDSLVDLLSPTSSWSPMTVVAREVITRHLLPLLTTVAHSSDDNKMTAENLAVCFAPALLLGPDRLEDAKMLSIIRRILHAAVDAWLCGLREACGIEALAFPTDLLDPTASEEYEDPLEDIRTPVPTGMTFDEQVQGILLRDNEPLTDERPPLPPRRSALSVGGSPVRQAEDVQFSEKQPVVLSLVPPSSFSTTETRQDLAESPTSYVAVTDGPHQALGWSVDDKEGVDESKGADFVSHAVSPKRKALTQEQIQNAERSGIPPPSRSRSDSSAPIVTYSPIRAVKRKPVHCQPVPIDTGDSMQSGAGRVAKAPGIQKLPGRMASDDAERLSSAARSRHASIPSEAPESPNIARIAQLFPARAISSTFPSVAPHISRVRAPSPGLLQRISSFEPSPAALSDRTGTNLHLAPGRTNLGRTSVDDLRRVYEERAATVNALSRSSSIAST